MSLSGVENMRAAAQRHAAAWLALALVALTVVEKKALLPSCSRPGHGHSPVAGSAVAPRPEQLGGAAPAVHHPGTNRTSTAMNPAHRHADDELLYATATGLSRAAPAESFRARHGGYLRRLHAAGCQWIIVHPRSGRNPRSCGDWQPGPSET